MKDGKNGFGFELEDLIKQSDELCDNAKILTVNNMTPKACHDISSGKRRDGNRERKKGIRKS